MKKILSISIFIFVSILTNGQDTLNYWQQKVDYNIHVALDDSLHSIKGNEIFIYHNNSPDTLDFIYIHLWPNAYSSENTALCNQMLREGNSKLYFADSSKLGYITNLRFSSNSQKIIFKFTDNTSRDIGKISFSEPLNPGTSIAISTSFYVKIPSSQFSRLGHSKQSYQITQWYPKPAVYDKAGWHEMHYLNQGEFYSEYGNYDVFISVPENYRIGATGDLVNCDKEEAWLDSISDATKGINKFSDDLSFPKSSSKIKILHYHQEKVHDFAWFADKRYHVLRGELILNNGHKVKTQVFFTNKEADLWSKSLEYLSRSTKFYSDTVGNYPYNQVTAVQGALSAGAGMEYPNVTIIGLSHDDFTLDQTITHEVGHNWFYGMFGFNERDYPWMDEGINTFYQTLYENMYYPNRRFNISPIGLKLLGVDHFNSQFEYYLSNKFVASYNIDQTSDLTSNDYTAGNYGISIYLKVPELMNHLHYYYGFAAFRNTMHSFFDIWKFKHPQPDDFIKYFENSSTKDLSWAFNDLLTTKKKIDYNIVDVDDNTGDSIRIEVSNKGEINSPILINATDNDGNILLSKWFSGFAGKKILALPKINFSEITLNDNDCILEYNKKRNFYKKDKIFHKMRTPKLKFFTRIPKPDVNTLYFLPIIGWNNYNKFMLGGLFYNHSIFEKKFEYELMPLYSFKTYTWNGSFGVHYNFYTKNSFMRRLSIGIIGKKYNYNDDKYNNSYSKLAPEAILYFRNPAGNTKIDHRARLRYVNIKKEMLLYYIDLVSGDYEPSQNVYNYGVLDFNYVYDNKRLINPFGIKINSQINSDMIKADISAHYQITYNKVNNGLDINLFVGVMHQNSLNYMPDYSYKMSSWDGGQDYLYDYTYLGRSERTGLWANQTTPSDGGFYLPSPLGRSRKGLFSLNLKSNVPLLNFIKIYGNFGYGIENAVETNFLYETGFMLSVLKGGFEVYFPVLISEHYTNQFNLNPNHTYWNTVRFTMRLDLLDPFQTLKRLNL